MSSPAGATIRIGVSACLLGEKVRWDGRYDVIHKKHFGTLPDDSR